MNGLFALSIDPTTYHDDFQQDLFSGTLYQQHFGQDRCGLATSNGKKIICERKKGHFSPAFSEILFRFEGQQGIGYCGKAREPYHTKIKKIGQVALCFSGNIVNKRALINKYKASGHKFKREDDVEVVEKIITQERDIAKGLKKAAQEIEGSYVVLILTKDKIFAALDPNTRWPLVAGQKDGAIFLAVDTCGFENLNLKIIKNLQAGQIISIHKGKIESEDIVESAKTRRCTFLWSYYLFPGGEVDGVLTQEVRTEIGRRHARRDIERGFFPDAVTYIPDSGKCYAFDYQEEFILQNHQGKVDKVPILVEALNKYPYLGRSFILEEEGARKDTAYFKEISSRINLSGLVVVVFDDSIVRGTQAGTNLIPKLRKMGVAEIHMRIGNPQILSHCPYGKSTKKGELFSCRCPSEKEKCEELGADIVKSVKYSSVEDLIEAIGLPWEKLCVDCDLPSEE